VGAKKKVLKIQHRDLRAKPSATKDLDGWFPVARGYGGLRVKPQPLKKICNFEVKL